MSENKRHIILCVTNDLNYDQRMQRIAQSLSSEYRVTLVGRSKKSSPPMLRSVNYATHRLSCKYETGKWFYFEYQYRLFRYLWEQGFDAVYAVDLDSMWGGFSVALLRRKKRIYDAHEYFTELPELEGRPMTRLLWRLTARLFIPQAHLCFTVNDSLAAILSKRYGKAFGSVRNMPRLKNGKNELVPKLPSKVLLYQGVLNVGRGLETLIGAMPQLPGYECWLAGEGDLSAELRARAAKSEAAARIQFLGYLSPERLSEITQQAHIGLNLLENQSANYYYSLANKFFDYVQAGIPQISMAFPVYESLMEEYKVGTLLDKLEVDALVKAIQTTEAEYSILKKSCQEAAKVWHWEGEEQRLLEMVDQLW